MAHVLIAASCSLPQALRTEYPYLSRQEKCLLKRVERMLNDASRNGVEITESEEMEINEEIKLDGEMLSASNRASPSLHLKLFYCVSEYFGVLQETPARLIMQGIEDRMPPLKMKLGDNSNGIGNGIIPPIIRILWIIFCGVLLFHVGLKESKVAVYTLMYASPFCFIVADYLTSLQIRRCRSMQFRHNMLTLDFIILVVLYELVLDVANGDFDFTILCSILVYSGLALILLAELIWRHLDISTRVSKEERLHNMLDASYVVQVLAENWLYLDRSRQTRAERCLLKRLRQMLEDASKIGIEITEMEEMELAMEELKAGRPRPKVLKRCIESSYARKQGRESPGPDRFGPVRVFCESGPERSL